ncbi:hypothetical protein EJ110_NYTH26979 [Nymphaea thermarum]|nr:hypothetical protein EJ110_NYTH26979 [Nymphaea thermarum]
MAVLIINVAEQLSILGTKHSILLGCEIKDSSFDPTVACLMPTVNGKKEGSPINAPVSVFALTRDVNGTAEQPAENHGEEGFLPFANAYVPPDLNFIRHAGVDPSLLHHSFEQPSKDVKGKSPADDSEILSVRAPWLKPAEFTQEPGSNHPGPIKLMQMIRSRKESEEELEAFMPEAFKTEMCNMWQWSGQCPFGDRCHFAHGRQ